METPVGFHEEYSVELPWKTSCSMIIPWSIPHEIPWNLRGAFMCFCSQGILWGIKPGPLFCRIADKPAWKLHVFSWRHPCCCYWSLRWRRCFLPARSIACRTLQLRRQSLPSSSSTAPPCHCSTEPAPNILIQNSPVMTTTSICPSS